MSGSSNEVDHDEVHEMSSADQGDLSNQETKDKHSEGNEELPTVDKTEDRSAIEGTTLHVSNLTRNVEAKHLQEIFGTYGAVKTVDLHMDNRVGLSKGSAHIEFESAKDAEEALVHLDGGQIDGNIIKVSILLVNRRRRESPVRSTAVPSRRSPSPPSPRRPASRAQAPSRPIGPPVRSRVPGPYSASASVYGSKYGPAAGGDSRRRSPPARDSRGRGGPPARRVSPPRGRAFSPGRRRNSRERELPRRRSRSRSPLRVRARSPPPARRSPVRSRRRTPSPPPRRRRSRSPSSSRSSRSDSSSDSDSSRSSSSSRSRSRSRSRARN